MNGSPWLATGSRGVQKERAACKELFTYIPALRPNMHLPNGYVDHFQLDGICNLGSLVFASPQIYHQSCNVAFACLGQAYALHGDVIQHLPAATMLRVLGIFSKCPKHCVGQLV